MVGGNLHIDVNGIANAGFQQYDGIARLGEIQVKLADEKIDIKPISETDLPSKDEGEPMSEKV